MKVSILVPIYEEGPSLKVTLPALENSLVKLKIPNELVFLVDKKSGCFCNLIASFSHISGSRVVEVARRGKFEALSKGADLVSSDHLILVDADVIPAPNAFIELLRPILSGIADVTLSQPIVIRRGYGGFVTRLLERWATSSVQIWHLLRKRYPKLRWAISGHLYAISKKYFPQSAIIPLLDDASVGLYAMDQGARFEYVETATAGILAPFSYRDWLKQKIRVRQGWEALREMRPSDMAMLDVALKSCAHDLIVQEGISARFLLWHDRILRHCARLILKSSWSQNMNYWESVSSTKDW